MSYRSVLDEASAEYLVDKSRFIAHVRPVESEEEAQSFIEGIRKQYWDATHNVPVYLVGEKMEIQRFSDDREPSGTAGLPVLDMLKKEGLTNLVIVVTRYFGGIKLGKGGLVRAYTHSAQLGVEAARPVTYEAMARYRLTYAYPLHGKVDNQIRMTPALHDVSVAFGESVTREVLVPEDGAHLFDAFVELSGGKMEIERVSVEYHGLIDGRLIGG